MKKLVTLLLSLALVLSLAACGGEATPDASDDAPASSQNEESTENDNTENQIVFEEVVAIDNAECAVKITEIDPDNMWGYTLKAQLEKRCMIAMIGLLTLLERKQSMSIHTEKKTLLHL